MPFAPFLAGGAVKSPIPHAKLPGQSTPPENLSAPAPKTDFPIPETIGK